MSPAAPGDGGGGGFLMSWETPVGLWFGGLGVLVVVRERWRRLEVLEQVWLPT